MQNRNRKIVKNNYRRNEKIYVVLLMLMFMSGVEENISLKKKKRVIINMTPKILSQNPIPKKHLSPKA